MKKVLALVLTVVMVLSFAACSKPAAEEPAAEGTATEAAAGLYDGTPLADHKDEIKVAVIRNLGADEHTAQFLAGTVEEGTSLKFKVDTFTTDGNNAKFEDIFNQVLIGGYEGVVVSHGQDNAQELIQQAVAQGMKVVTFDTTADVEGVTKTAQDDFSLAKLSLDALVNANEGKTPKIIKMWIAGFPPMERRETVYKEYLEAGKIEEVAVVGEVGDFSNVAGLNADAIGSLLTRYPEGEIDAIWASWDAFATGAFTALNENNRNEIKIFGVDVSNADLQMIQAENSPWIMTAAADAKLVGTINMRLLAMKIAGEETPASYEIPATTINQADMAGDTTVETLADVYDTWGKSDSFDEEWMQILRSK
ncbi:MAG: sugar ABC transporter substrate-binding protein [Clostridia bacterium]|nr:sugar ABC transporter substrate-binding protein [Clostridia bacterium]